MPGKAFDSIAKSVARSTSATKEAAGMHRNICLSGIEAISSAIVL